MYGRRITPSPGRAPSCQPGCGRRQNGPASMNCSDFLLNNHTVEPRLFEPKSLLPGNGILPAETKAPKRLGKTKETIAET
jgi:hypothetical protein